MISSRTTLAVVTLAAALLACGPAGAVQDAPAAPSPSGTVPAAPATTTGPTSVPRSSGDDVSSYIACEIVTPQEVANLVGGPIFREPEQPPLPTCTYEVQAGPDGYAQFTAYIQPDDWVEPLIESTPAELGRPLAGVGDAAYLDYDGATETYDLVVLVRDRFGLEVVGDTEDGVLAIGELFLSRLVGP